MVPESVRWSAIVGVYLGFAAWAVVTPLRFVMETLLEVLGLPTDFATALVAGSGAAVGTAVWWAVVERRRDYTYLGGGVAGVVTALLTVGVWTLLIAVVYGPRMVPAVGFVILFVFAVVTPPTVVSFLPAVYARRRAVGGRDGGTEALDE